MKRWIAVINRSEARFFEMDSKKHNSVKFLSKIENPKGRLKAGDINADKPGYYAAGSTLHGGSMVKAQNPVERVATMFAKELIEYLEANRMQNKFSELTLFAEPHFLGKLRVHFSRDLAAITTEIPKDIHRATTEEIKNRIWAESQPESANI